MRDKELSSDYSTLLAPIGSVEQPTPSVYNDGRRDSVLQMLPPRLVKQTLDIAQVETSHETIFQTVLVKYHGFQSQGRSPVIDKMTELSVNDLLLAPPAAPLVGASDAKRNRILSASTIQDSIKKNCARKDAFRATARKRAIYQTVFPKPKLVARPSSTKRLAPGTHLYADSKRWPRRDALDRSLIRCLAVNNVDCLQPALVVHALSRHSHDESGQEVEAANARLVSGDKLTPVQT
ncbi:hypothetical protein LTR22_024920 [Elasticomyces elasticus]|nr:hypothetical protein LTR22_024920 [Elasticomyces elasticus]KAK5742286.1 hypothetical protein LTS12_024300 [Elasticomyces elasticus]